MSTSIDSLDFDGNESPLPSLDDVLAFLGLHFSKPEDLRRHITVLNLAISGSSALELLRPGSSGKDSDIDFYAPPNGHCIIGAIKALESAGVKFESPLEHIEKLFDQHGAVYHLSVSEFDRLKVSFDQYWGKGPVSGKLYTFMEKMKATISDLSPEHEIQKFNDEISFDAFQLKVFLRGYLEYDIIPNLRVIRGSILRSGKPVQIIYSSDLNLLEHICRFHSSATQMLITSAGAFHMYGKMALAGEAYSWDANTRESAGVIRPVSKRYKKIRDKWMERVFTFSRRPDGPLKTRRLDDEGALFRLYPTTFDQTWHKLRREKLFAFAWHESPFKTEYIRFPARKICETACR